MNKVFDIVNQGGIAILRDETGDDVEILEDGSAHFQHISVGDLNLQNGNISNVGLINSLQLPTSRFLGVNDAVTKLGVQTQLLDMGANNITNAATVTAADLYGTLRTPAQPFITSLGTQSVALKMGGFNIQNAGDIATSTLTAGNITVTGNNISAAAGTGHINLTKNLDMNSFSLLNVANLNGHVIPANALVDLSSTQSLTNKTIGNMVFGTNTITGSLNQNLTISALGSGVIKFSSDLNMFSNNLVSVGTINSLSLPSSNIVGLNDSQTLTNKTINASQLIDKSVTLAKLANIGANTLLGNNTASAATPLAIGVLDLKSMLNLQGINNGDQTISGDVTSTSSGSNLITTIASNSITSSKLADNSVISSKISTGAVLLSKIESIGMQTFLGNSSNLTSLYPEAMSVGTVKSVLGITNVQNINVNTWTGSSNIATIGNVAAGSLAAGFGTINSGAITSDSLTAKTSNGNLTLSGNSASAGVVTNNYFMRIASTVASSDSYLGIDGPTTSNGRYIACYQNGSYKCSFGLAASSYFFVSDAAAGLELFRVNMGGGNNCIRFPTYSTSGILRIDSGAVTVDSNFTTSTNTINVDTIIAKTTNSNLYIHPNGTGNVVTNSPVIYIASNRTNTDSAFSIDGPTVTNSRYIACYQNGTYKLSFGLQASSNFFIYDPVNNRTMFQAVIGAANPIQFPTYTTNGTLSVISGNGTLSSASDRRLKQDEELLNPEASLQKIMNLQPKKYCWKITPDKINIGFIAQDVEAAIPEAVDGKKFEYEFVRDGAAEGVEGVIRLDEDGKPVLDENKPRYRGLDQCAILSTLVSAFQALMQKNQALQERVDVLEQLLVAELAPV